MKSEVQRVHEKATRNLFKLFSDSPPRELLKETFLLVFLSAVLLLFRPPETADENYDDKDLHGTQCKQNKYKLAKFCCLNKLGRAS